MIMKKLVLISILIALSQTVGISFAADPSFSFSVVSGTELKLHCEYDMSVNLNAGSQNYNAFASTIKFNGAEVLLTPGGVNSPFTDNTNDFVTGVVPAA